MIHRRPILGTYYSWRGSADVGRFATAFADRLGIPREDVLQTLARELLHVVGDFNAGIDCYPPVHQDHVFNTDHVHSQWLLGCPFYNHYQQFIEGLRDELCMLRHTVPGVLGLYTHRDHMVRCAEKELFVFPIIADTDVCDPVADTERPDLRIGDMVREGYIISQGSALILPQLALKYILPVWADEEPVYVSKLRPELVDFVRQQVPSAQLGLG